MGVQVRAETCFVTHTVQNLNNHEHEQALRQCWVGNNSLSGVVAFYARDSFLKTSHKSNIALFKTNLPIGVNVK